MSAEARLELHDLQLDTVNVTLTNDTVDTRVSSWGSSFNSRKFYLHCFRDMQADEVFGWIWTSKCTNKWKVFAWLLLADRLNTRDILCRKGCVLQDNNYNCLLC